MGSARIDMQSGQRSKHQTTRNRNETSTDEYSPSPRMETYRRKEKYDTWKYPIVDDSSARDLDLDLDDDYDYDYDY